MASFDFGVIVWMGHHLYFTSPLVPHAIKILSDLYLTKGLVLIALLWWIWFRSTLPGQAGRPAEAAARRDHEIVVAAIASGLIALLVGRLLAHYLPFRVRPIYNPQLQPYVPITGIQEPILRTWNAFPSDHAMLWCAVATAICFVSRIAGIYAMLHALILICLPRVYLGLHHPTDVLAGIVLGVGIAWVVCQPRIRTRIAAPVLALTLTRYSGLFYAFAFVLSFELATQFDELRELVQSVFKHTVA